MLTLAVLIPFLSWTFLNAATCILLTIPVRHRLYLLPAILIPATISFRSIQHLSFLPGLSETWGLITLIGLIHFSSLLYIKKWTLRTTRQAGKGSKATDIWLNKRSWTHMYRVALNPRFIRVPYKDVIHVEQHAGSRVKSTAIHRKFSLARILWLLIKIGLQFLLNRWAVTKLLAPISISDFTPAKAILFRRLLRSRSPISTNEIVMRIWFTLNTIWTPILLLDSMHAALAILFIHVLRIDIPEDWPDLFGSPLEAFTLSRFWTMYVYIRSCHRLEANEIPSFWHRLHLSGYSDYVNLLMPRCMLRNAIVRRVLVAFSLFSISGLVHQVTSWQLDPGCSDYADLQFFFANAAALSLESALLQLASPGQPSKDDPHKRDHTQGLLRVALVRCVGYAWVMGFFTWAVPKFYYLRVYCTINQRLLLKQSSLP